MGQGLPWLPSNEGRGASGELWTATFGTTKSFAYFQRFPSSSSLGQEKSSGSACGGDLHFFLGKGDVHGTEE